MDSVVTFSPGHIGDRRFYYVAGQAVELWENPETPFGWGEEDLAAYAKDGRWEFLFNALVLSSVLTESTGTQTD